MQQEALDLRGGEMEVNLKGKLIVIVILEPTEKLVFSYAISGLERKFVHHLTCERAIKF